MPRKKVGFSYGNLLLFQIVNFKKRSFWLGLWVDQREPNLVLGIPSVYRVYNRKNFWYRLPRKKVGFSYVNLLLFQIINFKNRSFWLGLWVDQREPNLVLGIRSVYRVCNRENFWYRLPMKKVGFSYGNLLLFQINNFKTRSFWLGLWDDQREPKLVLGIPSVCRVY